VEHDLAHEVLDGRQMTERFPGYRLPHDILGVFQPDGGFLLPERATVAYAEAAQAYGAEIHGREEMLDWEPLGDGVRVITDRGEYTADSLVFTAGSWNQNLLPFLNGLAVPERQVLAWLQPEKPELFRPHNFPVFNLLVPEGRYYGFPIFAVPGFKFGIYHHFQEWGYADELTRDVFREDEEALREFAARYFPDGAGPTMTLKACLFTNSPDKHFIIDLHPDHPQVSFAAGFSGHGYKFASVIGEIMADLAERQETRHDISLFNLARFTGRLSPLYYKKLGLLERGQFEPIRVRTTADRRLAIADRRRLTVNRRQSPAGYRGRIEWTSGRRPQTTKVVTTNDWYGDTADPRYWDRDAVKPFW
jgi:sarcosine oxidase